MKKLGLFVLFAAFFIPHARAQSSLERCQSGACYGFGAPTGVAQNGFIYQDVSQTPPALYCPKNGAWVACGGSGGGGAVPSVFGRTGAVTAAANDYNFAQIGGYCPLQNSTNICITASPYNASGAGATTTTTSGTFAVGTAGTVASCSTFNAGNGVLITGAGAAGANYIGTVASCSGTALVVSPATSTSKPNGTVVQHDETAAFLAAIAAIAALPRKTGIIWGPEGVYLVNGPLLDTSGANAILPMPSIESYLDGTLVSISIKGFTLPSLNNLLTAGFNIKTSATTGNLFAGFNNTSTFPPPFPPFTNVTLEMENVTISAPVNTGAVMINATNLLAFQGRHLLVNTPGSGGAVPSNTTGGAIFMPTVSNQFQNELDDVLAGGFYTVYKLTEHTHAGRIYAASGQNCFVFDNNASGVFGSGDYEGNGVQIDYLWQQLCVNALVGGSGHFFSPLNISMADLETTTGHGIFDPNNLLYGIINVDIPSSSGSTTPCNANVTGATHVTIHYIRCQPESNSVAASGAPSGLLENWISQEGLGSTLVNSGLDFTNSVATTNVAWTTVAGFTGKVATYNATTSTAISSSITNTNFSGSTPFSVCQWVNPTTLAGFTTELLLANTSSTTGIAVQLLGASGGSPGSYNVNLFSSLANNIQVDAVTTISAGSASLLCFTYDATGVAAGVKMYINGTVSTATVLSDTLTGGSFASGVAMHIGSTLNGTPGFIGAIGRVRIFNRLLSAAEVTAMFASGPSAY